MADTRHNVWGDVRIPLVTSPTTIEKQNGPGKPTPLATPPTYPGGSTALRRRPATPARPAGGYSRCRQATSPPSSPLPPRLWPATPHATHNPTRSYSREP